MLFRSVACIWSAARRAVAVVLAMGAAWVAMWHAQLHTADGFGRAASDVAWSSPTVARLRQAVDRDHRLATAASLRHADRGGTADVRVVGAYEPALSLLATRYGNLLAGRPADGHAVNFQVRRPSAWLDRLAVSHLLAPAQDASVGASFRGWRRIAELDAGLALWQHPSPRARIEVPGRILVEPDPRAAVLRLAELQADTVLLSTALPHTPGARTRWQVTQDRAQVLELDIDTDQPVVLVVRDAADAGWHASLDGRDASWSLCDGLFQAVAVPDGHHQLSWTFHAPGLRSGAWLSLAAWSGLAVAAW